MRWYIGGLLAVLVGVSGPAAEGDEISWTGAFAEGVGKLRLGEGLLLIDSAVARRVSAWRLEGRKVLVFEPVQGRQMHLIKLPRGAYRWLDIEVPYFNLPYRLSFEDEDRWAFQVQSQRINYAGSLQVGERRGTSSIDVRWINRTAEVYSLLREAHPELLSRYGLVYAGEHPDDFLQHLIGGDQGENPDG